MTSTCSAHSAQVCNARSCCNPVGITSTLANGLLPTLEICTTLKCKCTQVVPDGRLFASDAERDKCRAYCDRHNLAFYVHCPLWANLAVPSESDEKHIVSKSRGVVGSQLSQIADMPAACVLHIGNNGSIANVADQINSMNILPGTHIDYPKQLLLEVSAGSGGQLGSNWNEIRQLFEAIDKPVGLCLDTQHAYASGMTDWSGTESVVKLFDLAAESSGGIQLFHLNDSKVDYRSNVDRHMGLGRGKIWYKNKDSLQALLERCRDNNINMVLETGDSQIKDLGVVQGLLKEN